MQKPYYWKICHRKWRWGTMVAIMSYLSLIVPLRAVETAMSSSAVFLWLVHSVTFFILTWYWFLLFLLFLSVFHCRPFAAKFTEALAGVHCLVTGQYIDLSLPGYCYCKTWASNQYNFTLLSIKTSLNEKHHNLYCILGCENMPKSTESEGDSSTRSLFPATPVSLKGQLNRSRWQQECKGLCFLCTSNSHMKENNLFIRALKSRSKLTDVWEKNTTCRGETVKTLSNNCKFISSSANASVASGLRVWCSCCIG